MTAPQRHYLVRCALLGLFPLLFLTSCCPCAHPLLLYALLQSPEWPQLAELSPVLAYLAEEALTEEREVVFAADYTDYAQPDAPPPPENGDFEALLERLSESLALPVLSIDEADYSDPDLPALTPVDPQSGKVGVSVWLELQQRQLDGSLLVVGGFARNGLDGMIFEFLLMADNSGWDIVDASPVGSTGSLAP